MSIENLCLNEIPKLAMFEIFGEGADIYASGLVLLKNNTISKLFYSKEKELTNIENIFTPEAAKYLLENPYTILEAKTTNSVFYKNTPEKGKTLGILPFRGVDKKELTDYLTKTTF